MLPSRLFEMPRQRKQENWLCVKLIAEEDIVKNKKYSSSDAIGAYCTVCESRISYSHSNPSNVARHMNAKHMDILEEFREGKKSKPKRKYWDTGSIERYLPSKKSKVVKKEKKASYANQTCFQMKTALWTCKSLRPFDICEDSMLQEMITFASNSNGTLHLPSRDLNRDIVMNIYKFSKAKLKDLFRSKREMDFFSCTSDIWLSRTLEAFLALTIHYLTEDFEMKKFVLKVDPLAGKYTANCIRGIMETTFDEWNLDVGCLSMMLRNSSTNMVRACTDEGITHFPCVGHSLHLIVGPLLLQNRKNNVSNSMEEVGPQPKEDDDLANVYDAFDDDDESWAQADAMKHVRDVVNDFRKATIFLKSTVNCKESLEKIPALQNIDAVLSAKLDVKTRWNSTYHMLLRMNKLMSSVIQVQEIYRSPGVKKEFQEIKGEFPELSTEKWALMKGLRMLLKPFDTVTKYLSREKYSSFAAAMSLLREVKRILSNPTLFDMSDSACTNSTFKINFKQEFLEYPFFDRVVNQLEECRVFLLEEFTKQFTDIDASILWISLLDPRFASTTFSSGSEKEKAKDILQNEVLHLVMRDWKKVENDMTVTEMVFENSDDEDFSFMWAGSSTSAGMKSPNTQIQNDIEKETIAVKHEVEAYIRDASASVIGNVLNPLLWWKNKRNQYPRVSLAARKWLSACSTSTPNERVLSICDVVKSAERNRTMGSAIAAQVFLHNNFDALDLPQSELLAFLD